MKIKIHKFKTLQNVTLSVPSTIKGGNGTGKTTILEAISFCLTGKDVNGSEFKQVYDNREDLHDAIADVSFTDDYGNEFRRTVEPVFSTTSKGEEQIKILRSTRCRKNGIDTTDFAPEFQDFYNFGTDYFFNQKENDQRAIFTDLMKSLLPHYDVNEAQIKLKSLKKMQRETGLEITVLRKELKGITDIEVIPISEELEQLENEYKNFVNASSDNQNLMRQINERNNQAQAIFRTRKTVLEYDLDSAIRKQKALKLEISELQDTLEQVEGIAWVGRELTDTADLTAKIEVSKEKLSKLDYFNDLAEYAKIWGRANPVVAENMERLKRLKYATIDNLPEDETLTDVCSACGVASQGVLDRGIENIVDGLKAENKQILEREMRQANNAYLLAKDEITRLTAQLNQIEAENKKIVQNQESEKRAFELNKTNKRDAINKQIAENQKQLVDLEKHIATLEKQLTELEQPKLELMPTDLTISDELKQAHQDYIEARDRFIGNTAINKNNAENKVRKNNEIDEKRALLLDVDTQISVLQAEITDYFSNLTNIVEREFSGKIKIGVQLQEYVITRDEYKDVFRITANGNIFPYDCNGALQNNVKLQVLATLQRLKGYTGITIMDNAEANTTQPIDQNGLNLVIAGATESSELIIK